MLALLFFLNPNLFIRVEHTIRVPNGTSRGGLSLRSQHVSVRKGWKILSIPIAKFVITLPNASEVFSDLIEQIPNTLFASSALLSPSEVRSELWQQQFRQFETHDQGPLFWYNSRICFKVDTVNVVTYRGFYSRGLSLSLYRVFPKAEISTSGTYRVAIPAASMEKAHPPLQFCHVSRLSSLQSIGIKMAIMIEAISRYCTCKKEAEKPKRYPSRVEVAYIVKYSHRTANTELRLWHSGEVPEQFG